MNVILDLEEEGQSFMAALRMVTMIRTIMEVQKELYGKIKKEDMTKCHKLAFEV